MINLAQTRQVALAIILSIGAFMADAGASGIITVTNTNEAGEGSLLNAINLVNQDGGDNTIIIGLSPGTIPVSNSVFSFNGNTPVINFGSLPPITSHSITIIDGSDNQVLTSGSDYDFNDGSTIGGSSGDISVVLESTVSILIVVIPTSSFTTPYSSATTTTLDAAHSSTGTVLAQLNHAQQTPDYAQTTAALTQPFQVAFSGDDRQMGDIVSSLSKTVTGYGGWFKALGSLGNTGTKGAVAGYNSHAAGFLAGIDRPVSDRAIAGIAAGYSTTHITQHDSQGNAGIETPRISLYGGYALDAADLGAMIGYANSKIDAELNIPSIGVVHSSHRQQEWDAALQASHAMTFNRFTLLPQAGLQYAHLSDPTVNAYGAASLDVASNDTDSLQPFAGLNLSTRMTAASGAVFTPEARLGYRHELLATDTRNTVNFSGSSFSTDGISAARNILSLGAGVNARLARQLDASLNYDADLALSHGTNQTLSADMTYVF